MMASHFVGGRTENAEGRSFVIIVTSRGGTLVEHDKKRTDDKPCQTVATSVFGAVFAALSSPGNTSIVCLFSLFVWVFSFLPLLNELIWLPLSKPYVT